ncbi:MAG: TAXI family TRAP transporter solute-binding subunit [Pseudomonadota bacterium]
MRAIVGILLAVCLSAGVGAQSLMFFSIGTGGVGGTYYPLGGVIANAISNPPGSRPCDQGGSCGVPSLIAVSQTSNGSVQNVQAVVDGLVESGFSQSDVAFWAYSGTGIFEGQEPLDDLRAIAALYPEHVHLVATVDSNIDSVSALAGKRVSIDTPDSGTNVDALLILNAFGLAEDDIQASYLKPNAAADAMRAGELDAFFIVAGYPIAAITELAEAMPVKLVPIGGEEAVSMLAEYGFFAQSVITAGTYLGNDDAIETLAVGAQWVTSAGKESDLIYAITQALWHDSTRGLLDVGHPKGASVTLETALDGIAIPLHPGAERFYREKGLLN